MAHSTLLAYPGCSMAGIAGSIDAFAIANRWCLTENLNKDRCEPMFCWDIVTLEGKPVEGRGGVVIQPNRAMDDVDSTDFILIPGFIPPLDFIGHVPAELTKWLRSLHDKNTLIGSACTGSFLLAETGLLDGRIATTNWAFARYFQRKYPKVNLKPERILTKDGYLICSGATTSFLDICLYIIEMFGSKDLSNRCSKSLLMEPYRQSQSPYFIFMSQKNHADEKVMEAQAHMEEKFAESISVETLADDLGISPRHFKRRFKNATGDSPLTYLQRIRIEAAKQKLETTTEGINEITWQVGYEDSNSFRKLFKKNTGLSPREYRERFTRIQGRVWIK